jgi:hypothetical protein
VSRKADQLVCSNSRNVQNNTFEFAAAAGCWNEAEIGGRKCASIQFEQNVVERFGKVDAWIDGVRVLCRPPRGKEAVLKSGALNHTMRQRQRLWERIKSPLLRLFGFDVKSPNHVLELVLDL